MRFDVHPTMMKQKQGAPCGRTLKNPRTITICTTERFPIGNALFLFVCGLASFGFDHNAGGFILRQKADSRFVAARRGYEMVYLSCDLIIYIA